jgi:hypothetical protein
MGYYEKVYVRRGTKFANVMPHSEVCMHMGIAGKTMGCELVGERPMVQLFEIESQRPFSAPILTGEAGIFTDRDGQFYTVRRVER